MGALTTRQLVSKRLRLPKGSQREQLQPGTVLQGRYRIVGTLGVGGFSSVYQARDLHFPSVTRLCAVKEMLNLAPDPQVRDLTIKSFEREASILATLDHPAVPDVYDFFTEGERSYLVMEFIRGQDLEALLTETKEFFPQESVLDWALQICDVLAYLHNHKPQPVVFRDLKPSNIMLDPHGRIRLIDFNIAKVFQAGEKGTMIGTEGYSPPEQYRGESGPAGDVYALGATMHHLLTRQDPRMEPPFSFGERPISAVNPEVPPSFEAIVNRCLAYAVNDRFADANALREALIMISRPGTGKLSLNEKMLQRTTEEAPIPAMGVPAPGAPAAVAPAAVAGDVSGVSPLWKFKCEDEIRSTAAFANGMVFVGAYDNNLYAVNAESGKFVWKYPSSDGIASSPYVYADSVFIGSADNYLYSLRLYNGRLNWRFQTGGPVHSSPRADFDHVFFGSDDGHLYAVNATNGRIAWKAKAHGTVRSSPYIQGERVYFGTEGGYVFCVDLSGQVKWQFQAKRSVTSTPTMAEDMVFVGSMDATVYALDANSGWAIWRFRARRPIISSPTVHNGVLYIGSSDGNVYALEIYSGRQNWAFEAGGQVNSTPAIWQDAVYFGATDGFIYSVDIKRGKLRWRYKTGGLIVASPIVVDGVVYIGSCDHHLYALPA
ncbi:MAG: serine/threonine-protein kinase [Chloroflexi bacterium]|nr:serine/threonine-protein kinase [Chloroflexota bacterium]MCI0576775.1 serine/threonine-protein kinase [Chloroflexota bacterium]MCI0645963.1 serine/threonine-protein kinase [Chloroflexota bacterium]MCI0731475.1 serine/threonine-protein kinase [Chloroflexota bacterium]